MDALIVAAAMEADSAKRSELNAEIQQKVLDECVIVPIYQQEDTTATPAICRASAGCIPGSAAEVLLLRVK